MILDFYRFTRLLKGRCRHLSACDAQAGRRIKEKAGEGERSAGLLMIGGNEAIFPYFSRFRRRAPMAIGSDAEHRNQDRRKRQVNCFGV